MSRKHTFHDSQFNDPDYKPSDDGDFELNSVFVIMSFNEDMDDTYHAIKDECAKLGLSAVRSDESIGSGIIIREVVQMIERAEFIVCDLTHERPNVYYELGYAHGVGNEANEILLLARAGTELHFDVSHLRVITYRSTEHLRMILSSNLKKMMELTRN